MFSEMTIKQKLLKIIENKENTLKKLFKEIEEYEQKIPSNIRNQIKGANSMERIKQDIQINKTEKDLLKNKQFRKNCYKYLLKSIKEIYLKNHTDIRNIDNIKDQLKYKELLGKAENYKENNRKCRKRKCEITENDMKCIKPLSNTYCSRKCSVLYDKKLLQNKPKSCLKNSPKNNESNLYLDKCLVKPNRLQPHTNSRNTNSFMTLNTPTTCEKHLSNYSFGNIFHHQTYLALKMNQNNRDKRLQHLRDNVRNAIMLGHEKNSLYGKKVEGFIKNLVHLTNS